MRAGEEQAFREYTAARMPALLRTAYLLCGDWHHSEDVVSTAIVKLYISWRRARRSENLDAYVRRMVVNVWLDEQRRPWRRERSTPTMPETAGGRADDDAIGTAAARRADLRRLLDQLPSRQRAVLVLRFYDDLSVEQTAEILGCTEGAVKTLTSRALTSVRRLLPVGVTTLSELEEAR